MDSKRPKLTTLNFIPNRSEKDKPFSVVFWLPGVYRERRFDTEEQANSFAKPWIEEYSKPKWSHRPISEWVDITRSPLYINSRTMEEFP